MLCKSKNRKGATIVEFAVVIPIFLTFIFGLIEIGRGFMASHLLTNAARVGCRVGIVSGQTTDNIKTAVKDLLDKQGISEFTTTVKVNGSEVDASTAVANDDLTVVVSASASSLTWMPVSRWLKGNITGQFTLRRE